MNELIKYIGDILGVNTSSTLTVLDMREELESIADFNRYRKFLRTNVNYHGMDFLTGFQKFIKLTAMYKEIVAREDNEERLKNGNKFALELSKKVEAIETHVLNFVIPTGKDDIDYKHLQVDGKPFFTSYETKELRKIGTLREVVKLKRSVSGSDPLYDLLVEKIEVILIAGTKEIAGNAKAISLPNIKRF